MRLSILERGHPARTKALLALIRVVSRQPVVDAVKVAMYRPDYYRGGRLAQEAMRGPSAWSVGDRELMAAFVSQVNSSQFCIRAHSTTARMWYGDDARVAATLTDLDSAPIGEPLRATLRMLGKLTRDHHVSPGDMREVLESGVSRQQVLDALAVCFAFNVTDRLADAFDFEVPDQAAIDAGARHLLKRGYG